MQTVKLEYERHQKEHKVIDQFQGNVEKCREAEVGSNFFIFSSFFYFHFFLHFKYFLQVVFTCRFAPK